MYVDLRNYDFHKAKSVDHLLRDAVLCEAFAALRQAQDSKYWDPSPMPEALQKINVDALIEKFEVP